MVKVDKTKEDLNITLGLWNRPFTDSENLNWIYLNFVFRDNQPKILYSLPLKLIFLQAEKEFVLSQDLQNLLYCSYRVQMKIMMSSRHTTTIFSIIKYQKISFIIVWEVAILLVMPKNITRGLKRPLLLQKAAFHSSMGLIQTSLNSQQISSFVKHLALQS